MNTMVVTPCAEKCIHRVVCTLMFLNDFHEVLGREMRIGLDELLQSMFNPHLGIQVSRLPGF